MLYAKMTILFPKIQIESEGCHYALGSGLGNPEIAQESSLSSQDNRQGALADGLHGLNPRITAHCYTPVQKATSVDLATGKTQRTSVVIKALWISEQIRHAHLGLFVYLIHLKAWRGKEEMALSTLGELWSKGN
jgi:hypothetical protein